MSRVLQANYRVTANDMGNDVAWASRTSERTSRAILADDAVDKLIKDGYTEKSLRDFLEAVVAATDGSRAKFAELNAKQVAAEAEAINMTSVEGKILQTTRTRLEQLQREPSLEDRAAQIKPLLEAAIKAMQKEKKPSESVGAGT